MSSMSIAKPLMVKTQAKGNKDKKDKKGRGIVTQILASSKRHRARASRV